MMAESLSRSHREQVVSRRAVVKDRESSESTSGHSIFPRELPKTRTIWVETRRHKRSPPHTWCPSNEHKKGEGEMYNSCGRFRKRSHHINRQVVAAHFALRVFPHRIRVFACPFELPVRRRRGPQADDVAAVTVQQLRFNPPQMSTQVWRIGARRVPCLFCHIHK